MIIKKKQLLTATLVLALGAAVFVNWYYTRQPEISSVNSPSAEASENKAAGNLGDAQFVSGTIAPTEKTEAEPEYFAKAKLDRNAAHDKAKESLEKIVNSEGADEESKKSASQTLAALAQNIKRETDCENLIKAKTASACVVIIDSDKVQVIVEKGKADDKLALQIKDIIIQQSEAKAENITIIEAK